MSKRGIRRIRCPVKGMTSVLHKHGITRGDSEKLRLILEIQGLNLLVRNGADYVYAIRTSCPNGTVMN